MTIENKNIINKNIVSNDINVKQESYQLSSIILIFGINYQKVTPMSISIKKPILIGWRLSNIISS